MQVEGLLFLGLLLVSCLCYFLIIACLFCSKKRRDNKLYDASTHLIRAGEAFADAGLALLRERGKEEIVVLTENGSSNTISTITLEITECVNAKKALWRIGSMLQEIGWGLKRNEVICYENEDDSQECFAELDDCDVFTRYTEVTQLLTLARDALLSAGRGYIAAAGGPRDSERDSESLSSGNELENLKEAIKLAGRDLQTSQSMHKRGERLLAVSKLISDNFLPHEEESESDSEDGSCCVKLAIKFIVSFLDFIKDFKWSIHGFVDKVPSMLFSLYSIVFRHSVEEVTVPGPGNTARREFLFGGYRIPKRPWLLHIYFLAMSLVIFNWFLLMFCDTAFYRKTATCNDLNVRRDAYLCFDVNQPITAGPIDCTDLAILDDPDVHVLCYLEFFNFPIALSLSFSFTQVIVILIHISFSITLWCVKNIRPLAALVLHLVICSFYVAVFVVYGPIAGTVAKFNEGANVFYGDRILRILMVIWGFITFLLLTLLSPYCWLIDKHHREYHSTFGHEGKKGI